MNKTALYQRRVGLEGEATLELVGKPQHDAHSTENDAEPNLLGTDKSGLLDERHEESVRSEVLLLVVCDQEKGEVQDPKDQRVRLGLRPVDSLGEGERSVGHRREDRFSVRRPDGRPRQAGLRCGFGQLGERRAHEASQDPGNKHEPSDPHSQRSQDVRSRFIRSRPVNRAERKLEPGGAFGVRVGWGREG